ncbi:MAG: hypothetical protein IT161_07205 [Bryobacterales bacterium]|nr:hypothetical protein [Bryobacterales bacterium]
MSSYISSVNNRLYAALESTYGTIPPPTPGDRTPFVQLRTTQKMIVPQRRDKTGTRSFNGVPGIPKRDTSFTLTSHLFGGTSPAATGLRALLQSAFAGPVLEFSGARVAAAQRASTIQTIAPHRLTVGQGIIYGDEIRFVAAVMDSMTIQLSAPFSNGISSGAVLNPSYTFCLGDTVPSVSIFDYWDPQSAVHRILRGAGVNELKVAINGDFHSMEFSGIAADLADSVSFESGEGGLPQFPPEPEAGSLPYDVIPGHLGQIWIGAAPARFCTVTEGVIRLNNSLDTRKDEFGCPIPKALVPGARIVDVAFSLYEQDDAETAALYQAARQRSPITLTLQLGQSAGQLCGLYVPSFVPEVPSFDDSEPRLTWKFDGSRAQGAVNDELFIAFG